MDSPIHTAYFLWSGSVEQHSNRVTLETTFYGRSPCKRTANQADPFSRSCTLPPMTFTLVLLDCTAHVVRPLAVDPTTLIMSTWRVSASNVIRSDYHSGILLWIVM